jgi:hypothetical protein
MDTSCTAAAGTRFPPGRPRVSGRASKPSPAEPVCTPVPVPRTRSNDVAPPETPARVSPRRKSRAPRYRSSMEDAGRRSYLAITSSRVSAAAFIRGVDGSASAPGLLLRCTRAVPQRGGSRSVHKVLTSLDRSAPGRARYGAPFSQAGPFGHIQRSMGCLRCRHKFLRKGGSSTQ